MKIAASLFRTVIAVVLVLSSLSAFAGSPFTRAKSRNKVYMHRPIYTTYKHAKHRHFFSLSKKKVEKMSYK